MHTATAIDCWALIIAIDTALRKVHRAKPLTARSRYKDESGNESRNKFRHSFALISEVVVRCLRSIFMCEKVTHRHTIITHTHKHTQTLI